MTYVEGADYFVRQTPMPIGIHGAVSLNDDGTYNVYINEKDLIERQREAYKHEKRHITGDDFSKSDVRVIEGL